MAGEPFFVEHQGIKQATLAERGYDPIATRMEARFDREATYNEIIKDIQVTVAASPDWSRWKIRHSYAPGADVAEALDKLPRAEGFEELRSLIRSMGL